MDQIIILGIYVKERSKNSLTVQNLLTKYGCSIKTRIGLHEVSGEFCSNSGLILLELTGNMSEIENLERDLKSIDDIEINKMTFKK